MRCIEKMELHSPLEQFLPECLVKGDISGESHSGILFVNKAYDSRRTGINKRVYLPSAYRLYLGDGFISFSCNQLKCRQHKHFAIQLFFNFEAPFRLSIDGSYKGELFFSIIPSFIPHDLINPAGKHFSILVDPLSAMGSKLNALFEDPESLAAFNRSVMNDVYPSLQARLYEFEAPVFFNNTIKCLNDVVSGLPGCRIDDRIRHAVIRSQVQVKNGKRVSAEALAGWTSLSESRAQHLFKEETGVSYMQYLKWLRITEAIKYACVSGSSLTEAAHAAGFSDSSHFSRMFKDMFGLTPSSILQ